MLELLHIENIAVIESADIAFQPGFNALTGETGAGKSIVIDAMGAVLGGRAIVGKNCHIGAGTVLAGVVEPASATPVIIEDDVMIGANAVVLEGVRVGKGAVVAAGAVCVEDVPAGAVVAGVPARVIKMRDAQTDSKTGLEEDLRQL